MRTAFVLGLVLLVSVAAADWSENFDSYAAGSGLNGQGGWFCWDENPAYDAYVTDAQALSAPNAVEIEPTSDIVHEFDATEGDWVMTGWSYIPTGTTGNQFFILLTHYEGAQSDWALQLKFNLSVGQMTVTEGSGIVDIIRDQWVEVRVEISLGSNLQSIYYNDVFIETIPWSPVSGIYEIGALDLFSDGGSSIYWDDLSLEEAQALQPSTWASIKTSIN